VGKERDFKASGAINFSLLDNGIVDVRKWIEALLECKGTCR